MFNITFRNLKDTKEDFIQLHKWCQKEFVYEWFEQRKLSYEEIVNKYKTKLEEQKQDLFIIRCDKKDIGLVQIYKFNNEQSV